MEDAIKTTITTPNQILTLLVNCLALSSIATDKDVAVASGIKPRIISAFSLASFTITSA